MGPKPVDNTIRLPTNETYVDDVSVSIQSMRVDFKWYSWTLVEFEPLRPKVSAIEKKIVVPNFLIEPSQIRSTLQTEFRILDLAFHL